MQVNTTDIFKLLKIKDAQNLCTSLEKLLNELVEKANRTHLQYISEGAIGYSTIYKWIAQNDPRLEILKSRLRENLRVIVYDILGFKKLKDEPLPSFIYKKETRRGSIWVYKIPGPKSKKPGEFKINAGRSPFIVIDNIVYDIRGKKYILPE